MINIWEFVASTVFAMKASLSNTVPPADELRRESTEPYRRTEEIEPACQRRCRG